MSAWLTRIVPDLTHRDARRDLKDSVALHHRIMCLAPDELGEEARRQAGVLFRLDDTKAGTVILVQSVIEPDTSRLPEGYGTVVSRPLDPVLDALRTGVRVRYRIIANATRKLGKNTVAGRPRQIVPLDGAAAEEWWQRQATSAGLVLHTVTSTPIASARGQHRGTSGRINHACTRFDGTATVTDAKSLREAMLSGIGRGKSYGCGLLSIAP